MAFKNNKAVDVVCERIIDKINFPVNLRLGPKTDERDYTTEFLDLLDSALSGISDKSKIEEDDPHYVKKYDLKNMTRSFAYDFKCAT